MCRLATMFSLLELAPGARIERDVMLYRSVMTRANDAAIAGTVHNETGFSLGAAAIWIARLSFTIVVIAAGLLFGVGALVARSWSQREHAVPTPVPPSAGA